MNFRYLPRWLLAIVMIVCVGAAGTDRFGPSTPSQAGSDSQSVAISLSASGWSGTQGIMPGQPRIDGTSSYERGARMKVPAPVGAITAASLGLLVAARRGFRRRRGSPLALALRAWSLPRRAPPLLQLG